MSTNSEFFAGNADLEQFLREQDVAQITKIRYRNSIIQFYKFAHTRRLAQPTRADILLYKEHMANRGLRASTRAAYLVALRRFFIWLEDIGRYKNVARNIKGKRQMASHHAKDPLQVDQALKILRSINRDDIEGKRDAALINLLIRTGLRLIEVQRANIGDIETKEKVNILWVRGKGADDKDQFVVLTDNVMRPLLEYLACRREVKPNQALFISTSNRNLHQRMTTFSLSRIVKKHMQAAGFNSRRLTAHSLRHTFGTLSMKAGADINAVQLAMRHTNPVTTQIYTRDILQEKRLEQCAATLLDDILPPVI